jgi:hypothetical protein
MVALMPDTAVMADTTKLTAVETGVACKSGRYIYYSYGDGVRTDLIRFDTKTKKKKSIVSYKYKGESTHAFYNISVKGKYIYAVWNLYNGTDASYDCIYRFSKDGKSKKRLALGGEPVIIGNRIYYFKAKKELFDTTYNGEKIYATVGTGELYSMKLDGSDKKKEGGVNDLTLATRNGYKNMPVTVGKYYYYISNNGKTIYRKNTKTGNTNKIITFKTSVRDFMVLDGYIMATGYIKNNYSKLAAYCVKADGSSKTKLISWNAAE